jgi:hypothetical protein
VISIAERKYKTNIGELSLEEIAELLDADGEVKIILPEEGRILRRVKEKKNLFLEFLREKIPKRFTVEGDLAEYILEETVFKCEGCPLKGECRLLTARNIGLACNRIPLKIKLTISVEEIADG